MLELELKQRIALLNEKGVSSVEIQQQLAYVESRKQHVKRQLKNRPWFGSNV